MYSNFAQNKLDYRKRAELVAYLVNHSKWSDIFRPFAFANCVKLRQLDIPRELQDAAYAMLEMEDPFNHIGMFLQNFADEHEGTAIYFEGRSGGWLVLDTPVPSPDELASMEIASLRLLARLVRDFDAACDEAVSIFMSYVTDYQIEDQTILVEHNVKVLVEKE